MQCNTFNNIRSCACHACAFCVCHFHLLPPHHCMVECMIWDTVSSKAPQVYISWAKTICLQQKLQGDIVVLRSTQQWSLMYLVYIDSLTKLLKGFVILAVYIVSTYSTCQSNNCIVSTPQPSHPILKIKLIKQKHKPTSPIKWQVLCFACKSGQVCLIDNLTLPCLKDGQYVTDSEMAGIPRWFGCFGRFQFWGSIHSFNIFIFASLRKWCYWRPPAIATMQGPAQHVEFSFFELYHLRKLLTFHHVGRGSDKVSGKMLLINY